MKISHVINRLFDMKKMLKKTNLSAQNDCLLRYVNKKSNLQSQGRKITGRKHDPKYGHFFVFSYSQRGTCVKRYVSRVHTSN